MKEAEQTLKKLLSDLADLDKNEDLKKTLADCLAHVPHPSVTARLEAFSRELGPAGSFFWLRQTTQRRLQKS